MPSETIHFTSARQLSLLYADDERNLEEAEHSLGVSIASRDDWVTVEGKIEPIARLKAVFELLEAARAQGLRIRSSDFHTPYAAWPRARPTSCARFTDTPSL